MRPSVECSVVLPYSPKHYSQDQQVTALAVAQWLKLWLDPDVKRASEKRGSLWLLEPPELLDVNED